MSDFTELHLHLGAHKTATTHLQKTLYRHKRLLRLNKVRFIGPRETRKTEVGLTDCFKPGGCPDPSAILRELAGDATRVILSDENYAGQLARGGVYIGPQFYKDADQRLAYFNEALGGRPVRLFFGVRDPARYLTSAYSQNLLAGHHVSFEHYLGGVRPEAMRWSELLLRLRDVPWVEDVTIWRHEDYPQILPEIVGAMVHGGLRDQIKPEEGKVHTSLSQEAVEHIMSASPHEAGQAARAGGMPGSTRKFGRAVSKSARERFPNTSESPPPQLWRDEDYALSRATYDADIAWLTAQQRITVLGR